MIPVICMRDLQTVIWSACLPEMKIRSRQRKIKQLSGENTTAADITGPVYIPEKRICMPAVVPAICIA